MPQFELCIAFDDEQSMREWLDRAGTPSAPRTAVVEAPAAVAEEPKPKRGRKKKEEPAPEQLELPLEDPPAPVEPAEPTEDEQSLREAIRKTAEGRLSDPTFREGLFAALRAAGAQNISSIPADKVREVRDAVLKLAEAISA